MEKIESGVITNILKKLTGFLSSILEYAIKEYPDNITNVKVDSKGTITMDIKYGAGTIANLKLVPKDKDNNIYHASIQCISGPGKQKGISKLERDIEFTDSKDRKFIDFLTEYGEKFDEAFEEIKEEHIDSAIKCNIKLHKTTLPNGEVHTKIKKIVADTIPSLPLIDIVDTVSNPYNFDEYADGDICVSVEDTGNEIVISDLAESEIGEFCLDREILHTISKAYASQICLQAIQFGATGDGVSEICDSCGNYISSINYAISVLSQIYMRQYPCAPASICEMIDSICTECSYDLPNPLYYKEALGIVVNIMDSFAASLELICYNLETYERMELEYSIRDIKNILSFEHKIIGF